MIKIEETHICDFCKREIQTVTINVDGEDIAFVDLGRPKHKEIRTVFPHTCPECTVKLDRLIDIYEAKQKEQAAIMEVNRALNEARKIKLGTKG